MLIFRHAYVSKIHLLINKNVRPKDPTTKTYDGKSCTKCGSSIRYKSTRGCVSCCNKGEGRTASIARYQENHRQDILKRRRLNYQANKTIRQAKAREYSRQPIVQQRQRGRHFLSKYKITKEDFQQMVIQQAGNCAICLCPLVNPHVDHNHQTLLVRSLCPQCNHGLGNFKDRIDILHRAIT